MSRSNEKETKKEKLKPQYDTRGSIWHRWDPHLHCPGTILNDQYKGENALNDFLTRIEESDPLIKVLGITDYYSIDMYERVIEEKLNGRLPNVALIFPNIELRFGVETASGKPINGHILVSPDDHNHIDETKRFLSNLEFIYNKEKYRCSREDLIKLGYKCDKALKDDRAALATGTIQFKVSYTQLFKEIVGSSWAQKNILLGVSGNTTDGTSGLKKDASFNATRTEIERHANIIFSSQPKQREFWLGKGIASMSDLNEKWGGTKPCLHGSDAHGNNEVGKPALERYTWVKGDLVFESLKQACIEPEERVIIGPICPDSGSTSKIIQELNLDNASWLQTSTLKLNSGLIAIIGARGSGKTALADFIAAAGYALSPQLTSGSFIKRASNLIEDEKATLTWTNGESTYNWLRSVTMEDILDSPRVQYLSQQFVEDLCSAEGLTDKLMEEIERVIFQAHRIEDRLGASNFDELLEIRSANSKSSRQRNEEVLRNISSDIMEEYERKDSLPQLRKAFSEKKSAIENDIKVRQALVGKGKEKRESELSLVSSAVDKVRLTLDAARKRHLALLALQSTISSLLNTGLPNQTQKIKQDHRNAGLTDLQWRNFDLGFAGGVEELLIDSIAEAVTNIESVQGTTPIPMMDNSESYLDNDQDIETYSYNVLFSELKRLQLLIGIDKENTKKYSMISDRITKNETAASKLQEDIGLADGAIERIIALIDQRKSAHREVFQSIVEEERELKGLYEPLMENLKSQTGTLSKLVFYVHRMVDVEAWATEGEELLDLRKAGPLKGKGTLAQAAAEYLKKNWESGSAEEVAQSMELFRSKYNEVFFQHAPVLKTDRVAYRAWIKKLGDWLYSANHIQVTYGIEYDHLDIKQLSPGTRGIVLLMLYLAIDKEDDRPLIIDQPEENLDPKSIFDELVPIFRTAKHRRQIIIITHNANLVINTDADQVIVATCKEHLPNKLPPIAYASGGIENPEIRNSICEILEGGEAAFRERARRLRINF
ncbi:MAG: AAA family ATPase [Chitinophagaceae bacterium]|nr:AAA family ATPase [Chitinophagaceae bacterium]